MPEVLLKEEHYREELIDGVTMMAPAPSESHNNIMANILVIFRNYLRGKHCRAYGDNIDVFLDDKSREDLEDVLGVPVIKCKVDGYVLLDTVLGLAEGE